VTEKRFYVSDMRAFALDEYLSQGDPVDADPATRAEYYDTCAQRESRAKHREEDEELRAFSGDAATIAAYRARSLRESGDFHRGYTRRDHS
jgi:hypothetical protein